jgi:hypothetical protein
MKISGQCQLPDNLFLRRKLAETLDKRLGVSQSRPGLGDGQNIPAPFENRTLVAQLVASHYRRSTISVPSSCRRVNIAVLRLPKVNFPF